VETKSVIRNKKSSGKQDDLAGIIDTVRNPFEGTGASGSGSGEAKQEEQKDDDDDDDAERKRQEEEEAKKKKEEEEEEAKKKKEEEEALRKKEEEEKNKLKKRRKPQKGGKRSKRAKKLTTDGKAEAGEDSTSEDVDEAQELKCDLSTVLAGFTTAASNLSTLEYNLSTLDESQQEGFKNSITSCKAKIRTLTSDHGRSDGGESPQTKVRKALAVVNGLLQARERREAAKDAAEEAGRAAPSEDPTTATTEAERIKAATLTLEEGKKALDEWEVTYVTAKSPLDLVTKRQHADGDKPSKKRKSVK